MTTPANEDIGEGGTPIDDREARRETLARLLGELLARDWLTQKNEQDTDADEKEREGDGPSPCA